MRRTQHDVAEDLVVRHLDVADGDAEAEDLLELELDGRTDLDQLVVQVLGVRDRRRELAGCEQSERSIKSGWEECVPLERPGPRRRGICLMSASDARKASYFLASFLTSFLFLLSLKEKVSKRAKRDKDEDTHFFKSSTDMYSRSICLARSISAASARMQIDMRGRGTFGSLSAFVSTHTVHGRWRRSPPLPKKGEVAGAGSLDGARETLVTLRVVVLEADLELDRLDEVATLLARRVGEQLLDGAPHASH
jgi:hypothetical protein